MLVAKMIENREVRQHPERVVSCRHQTVVSQSFLKVAVAKGITWLISWIFSWDYNSQQICVVISMWLCKCELANTGVSRKFKLGSWFDWYITVTNFYHCQNEF